MNTDNLRPIRNAEEALQVELPKRAALREPITGEQDVALRYPLRGTPVRFHEPTEPVADDEWEALQ